MPTRRLRKSPRLKDFDYVGPLAAHLVVVTRERLPLFRTETVALLAVEALHEASTGLEGKLHAYCVMPDHVHVLVELGDGVSLEAFANRFKQLSGFRLKQATGDSAWQTSYWDHVLRSEEALTDVAAYIWQNPVAAGLVTEPHDYRFSGPVQALHEAIGDPSLYSPPRSFGRLLPSGDGTDA